MLKKSENLPKIIQCKYDGARTGNLALWFPRLGPNKQVISFFKSSEIQAYWPIMALCIRGPWNIRIW